jgi:hypothetical protein
MLHSHLGPSDGFMIQFSSFELSANGSGSFGVEHNPDTYAWLVGNQGGSKVGSRV